MHVCKTQGLNHKHVNRGTKWNSYLTDEKRVTTTQIWFTYGKLRPANIMYSQTRCCLACNSTNFRHNIGINFCMSYCNWHEQLL